MIHNSHTNANETHSGVGLADILSSAHRSAAD